MCVGPCACRAVPGGAIYLNNFCSSFDCVRVTAPSSLDIERQFIMVVHTYHKLVDVNLVLTEKFGRRRRTRQ